MRKNYLAKNLLFFSVSALLFIIASCKKDKPAVTTPVVPVATPTKLGLYEAASQEKPDSPLYREIFITVSKIGTKTLSTSYNDLIFDTGSGGMVVDAHDILPASMITDNGLTFTGDSTVVDSITITNQKSTVSYGDDANSSATVTGYLAYASVTIGESDGNIIVKRLPFFLYYKSVDGKGNALPTHDFDVFGANSQNDITFPNTVSITSPFSYFNPGNGLTKGFKLAALGNNFTDANEIPITPGVITLGLTAADLSSSSGFIMNQLSLSPNYPDDGYIPYLPGTINYNGTDVPTTLLFDTGTNLTNYLEDPNLTSSIIYLPVNTSVKIATTSGFSYAFTVTQFDNRATVENPKKSGVDVSILNLNFFMDNEYLLDFTHHKLGVKNN